MGLLASVQDPLLKQVVQRMEANLKPDLRDNYEAIVVSGMKLMYSQETHTEMDQYLDRIQTPNDIPHLVAHGIVKLLSIVQNESKQSEPLKAAGPACITLMAQALEFVEQKKGFQIDRKILDETTRLIKEGIFALYKITPETLQALQQRGATEAAAAPGAPPSAQPPAQPPQPPVGVPA